MIKASPTLTIAKMELIQKLKSRKVRFFLILYVTVSVWAGLINYSNFAYSLNQEGASGGIKITGLPPVVPNVFLLDNTTLPFIFGALFAISLAFDSLNRERLSNSLVLLASYPIKRIDIINGKVLGLSSVLPFAVVPSVVAIYVSLLLSHLMTNELAWRIGGLAILTFLYLFSWLAFTVLFSTIMRAPQGSLAASIALWITLLPSIFALVAKSIIQGLFWRGVPYTVMTASPAYLAMNNAVDGIFPQFRYIHAIYGYFALVGTSGSGNAQVGPDYLLSSASVLSWLNYTLLDFILLCGAIILLLLLSHLVFRTMEV